ncbi:MAG: hypothetical protein BMS9Abin31_0650 [Gammaproteobacteria bacterium]|nr:MAG: hypothetical protein BMS9Abin31_0650 [Gammaproteobacteria bacterium]
MNKAELERYYLETTYSVFIDDIQYDCKIGEIAPTAINKLVTKEQPAAILTACNPQSQALSSKENESRNSELKLYLQQHNYSVLKALGQGSGKDWPAEESFFILNIQKQEAEKLAIDYGQYAYVWLEGKKPVSLVFTGIWYE